MYEFTAISTTAALIAATIAYAALTRLAALRRRYAKLETALEIQQDALWRAEDRADRAIREGAQALRDAEARAQTSARAKSKFLATVTHEMRTPLSGVIGTNDLLLDTPLAPDQRTYAQAVKQSAEAMLSLVDEILDLSRMEADRLVLQNAPFAVAELVEGVAELLAPRAQAKGLDFAVAVGANAPERVNGDVLRVRQVLLNLAGNAIKFTASGGVGLRVDVDDDAIRFSVSDTGAGFDAAEAERLFEEFERGADPAAPGVGLGLAISRKLARAMAGELVARAAPGEGATFTLLLPKRMAIASALPVQDPAPLAGRRILVVSDAPFGGPWLVERIAGWGADADLVWSGARIEAAATGRDTALIDRSASSHPSDLAAAARRGGARRVLLLLTPAERRDLPTLAADGFDGYLVKPVRAASLIRQLEEPGAERAPAPHEVTPAVAFPGSGLRVLLAEDDPVSALIALSHLTRLGHSAHHVADGVAAAAAFEARRFDVALLDLRMPFLHGCEVARRIRAYEAESGRSRALLIALTANAGDDDRAEALEAGMDHVLVKPLDRGALAALLAGGQNAARVA